MAEFRICPIGDTALQIEFENEISPAVNARLRAFIHALDDAALPALVEYVPAYRSVTLHYRPQIMRYTQFCSAVSELLQHTDVQQDTPADIIELPVCYGGTMGEDLAFVAKHCGLSESEVIRIHSGTDYLVYMLGFTPGFPYLGGMDERIAAPRLEKPRTRIPAGSVGIAGTQTGAYPLDTPGGWQIIGRTPVKLYDPHRETPILLRAGELVRFIPISEAEYHTITADKDYIPNRLSQTKTEGGA